MTKAPLSSQPADKQFSYNEIARQLRLEVVQRASFFPKVQLEGRRKGLLVRVRIDQSPQYSTVDHRSLRLSERELTHHELRATVLVKYKFGAGPRMKLLREGTFRSWLKQFGYQDIEIGDQNLDFQLTIKGEPEEEIKKILLDNLNLIRMHCHEKVATLPQSDGSTISAEGTMSTLARQKGIAGLSSLIDVLVSLASSDLVGAQSLLALPGSREEWLDQDLWSVRLPGANAPQFTPQRISTGFVTRASVVKPAGVPEASFPGSDRNAISQHFGNPHLADSLGKLKDTRIEIDSKDIALCWPRLVQEPELLLAGARLLALMVNPQHLGAYR